MDGQTDILDFIKESAAKKILFLPHAVRQMSKPDRMISTKNIRQVVQYSALIEDYPEDPRGHSCLVLGFVDDNPIHVVCAPKEEYLAIITAYVPSEEEWEDSYTQRKKQ